MATLTPTSPAPGPGYTWNAQTGRWEPRPTSTGNLGINYGPTGAPGSGFATAEQSQAATATVAGQPTITSGAAAGISDGKAPVVGPDGKPAEIIQTFEQGDAAAKASNERYFGGQAAPFDHAAARQARDELQKTLTNYADRPAPQATGAQPTSVTQAKAVTVGAAAPLVAPTVGPATTAAGSRDVSAAPVTAGQVGPAATFGASRVAATPGATAGSVAAPTIDKTEQQQFRAGEVDLVQQLQAAARGGVPSAAELQGRRQAEEAVSSQLGFVAMNRGRGQGAALAQAGMNVAKLQQKAAADAAILRATEQEKARGQLGAALGQARGADISLATKGAEMGLAAGTTTAQLGTQVSISNADRIAAAAMKDADLEQAARAGNAAAQNEMQRRQAELTTTANTAGAQLSVEAQKSNQAADTAKALADAAAKNRMTELQAQITSQNGIASAEQQNELTKLQAQLSTTVAVQNSAESNATARADAANQLQVTLQNLDAKLKQQGMDDEQRRAYLDAWVRQNAQILAMDTAYYVADKSDKEPWEKVAGVVQGLADTGAKAYAAPATASDRRVKTDVVKVTDKAAQRLADVLGAPSEWTYTGKHDDGHRHVGWMAQDLEKDELGKKFVREGEDGTKSVDYQGLTAALLAAALRSRKGRR